MHNVRHAETDETTIDSPTLAAQLRSGPIRAMLDRIVRSAAEMAGVPYMVLGIRYGDYYEFISTHGIPLTHYSDRVPARVLHPKLFAREVEVSDLQKQAQFTALSIAPVAKTWRYGGNAPVRTARVLTDDGVLALSCADTRRHETGGAILGVLRQHAEFISDLIWLSSQVQRPGLVANPMAVIISVLQAAVARFQLPVCIIDQNQCIVGLSDTFAAAVRTLGDSRLRIGERINGAWLTPFIENAIEEALTSETPKQWLPVAETGSRRHLLDLFPFSFPELGKFAIFSLHDGRYGLLSRAQQVSATVNDVATDSAGLASDGAGPVSRFLDETLIRAQRLNRRNQTSYLGVRRWRSAIKQHQIAALRALKSDPPAAFVDAVVAELADAVRTVYGAPGNCIVVPVPCGHSGPGCLSSRLAQGLADALGTTMVDAFDPIALVKGSSHPRRNAARPSMRLAKPVDKPVILVDDVASSGSHIDEAATLLRGNAPSVWPVAWIAP
jgi:hypothetical protein